MIIPCPACGKLNKVLEIHSGEAVCGKCHQPLPDLPGVASVDEPAFESIVAGADRPVLVDFSATWCGPCKMLAPILDRFAKRYPHIQVLKVDIDGSPVLSDRFQITMVPTLIIFEQGQEKKRASGAFSESELEGHFQEWLPRNQ